MRVLPKRWPIMKNSRLLNKENKTIAILLLIPDFIESLVDVRSLLKNFLQTVASFGVNSDSQLIVEYILCQSLCVWMNCYDCRVKTNLCRDYLVWIKNAWWGSMRRRRKSSKNGLLNKSDAGLLHQKPSLLLVPQISYSHLACTSGCISGLECSELSSILRIWLEY